MNLHVNYLRNHAIENVWCSPGQDKQFTFKLPLIVSASGAVRTTIVNDHHLELPDGNSRFAVFQIGGIPPASLNLLSLSFYWKDMTCLSNEKKTTVRLYNQLGVVCGLGDVYYRYTNSSNLLIAVRINPRVPIDWGNDSIYLSLYTNAFWNTKKALNHAVGFKVFGQVMDLASDIQAFKDAYQEAQAKQTTEGQLLVWHNGLRKEWGSFETRVGDSVFLELDGSVKETHRFEIPDLLVFDSTLDSNRKYLIHPPKSGDDGTVDYFDDVEFFVVAAEHSSKGALKYPVVDASDVRQLTHRDYSLMVGDVLHQASFLERLELGRHERMSVEVRIRDNGFEKALIHEAAFIQELYKLNDHDIIRAMHGIDSTVPFWQAAQLESSAYPRLMRAKDYCDVDYQSVEDAYGYYAMAKALAMTPSRVLTDPVNGGRYVKVPYLLMFGCTAYEYDQEGKMIDWQHFYTGESYTPKNDETAYVEFIAGLGSANLAEYHGVRDKQLDARYNWRVYLRVKSAGVIGAAFEDVTGSDKYTFDNGHFQWKGQAVSDYVTLRSDQRFFAQDYLVQAVESQLSVAVVTHQTHTDGNIFAGIGIPLGQSDVFLNGYSLTRGLHYFVSNGKIQITAKEYFDQTPGAKQKIHVRMYGFCRKDGSMYPEGDHGYIEHGVLSRNNRFNVRDGRCSRVVVGGKLTPIETLEFSEDNDEVRPTHAKNGTPYLVKDLYVPLKPFALADTWELIEEARERVKKVSDYITMKKPEVDRGPVAAIARRHEVVSPFMSKIIYDVLYGRIKLPSQEKFSRSEIIGICKSYEPLLALDPISSKPDPRFVVIQPHLGLREIIVNTHQFAFLQQVIQVYAPGLISLENALRVS